jgi:hypothetical protein
MHTTQKPIQPVHHCRGVSTSQGNGRVRQSRDEVVASTNWPILFVYPNRKPSNYNYCSECYVGGQKAFSCGCNYVESTTNQ